MFDIGNSWQAIENHAQKHHSSRQHFRSGMSPIMRRWRAMVGSCQRRFLWCWRKFKLQVDIHYSIAMQEILKITSGLMYCGRGDGSDFSVEVDQVTTNLQMLRRNFDFFSFFFLAIGLLSSKGRGNTIFSADFGNMLNCKPEYDAGIDLLTIQVIQILQQSLFHYRNQKKPFSSYLDCELSCNPWRH